LKRGLLLFRSLPGLEGGETRHEPVSRRRPIRERKEARSPFCRKAEEEERQVSSPITTRRREKKRGGWRKKIFPEKKGGEGKGVWLRSTVEKKWKKLKKE